MIDKKKGEDKKKIKKKIKKPRTYRQRSFLGMLKYLSLMAGVSIERKKPCLCIHHFFSQRT